MPFFLPQGFQRERFIPTQNTLGNGNKFLALTLHNSWDSGATTPAQVSQYCRSETRNPKAQNTAGLAAKQVSGNACTYLL